MDINFLKEIKSQYPELNKKEKNFLSFGDKIHHWTILYRTFNTKSNHIQYVCQCDCGTIIPVAKTSLINNKSKSCIHCKGHSILGQKFGKLTVLYRIDNENNRGYWHCKCDCGNECNVNTSNLISGHTRSCGCLHKEVQHNRRIDLTGQRFGKLIALYPVLTKKDDKQPYWHCKCDCGVEKDIQAGCLKAGVVKSCGCIKSLGEENIIKVLKENNISFEYQYKFFDLPKYTFDFFVNNQYIIEYDGIQHFTDSSGWNNKINVQNVHKRDLLKNQYCFINNIPIIRIPYDVSYNLNDLILETTNFLLTQENENQYYEGRFNC